MASKVAGFSGSGGEKKDDDESYIPFQNLEKGIVLQEKRLFNETPINPRKCSALITKLLYLLGQGERFTKTEATDLFFAVTKLFQSKDIPLRRMMYLMLKELATMSNDVIIVISSLTKDLNSKNDLYRANAIRVLCRIIDSSLLSQVERYLKQSIVDKDPHVASAALVSGAQLMRTSGDVVKRWVNEVQEAVNSKHTMVQYHALALLHQIKQHDRLAVSKLVTSMVRGTVRSAYAHCLLIRYAAAAIDDSPTEERVLFDYLESCLRNKSEMVVYEAARAICGLRTATSKELTPAITVLQLFLSSARATVRFAAVRTLNKVAMTHAGAVAACNLDLENLITDTNRSIATLAITTLLKTGTEAAVERLMKQIASFMGDLGDEFKVIVVDAIRALCHKFPAKHRALMAFLATTLRDEGGAEYKRAVVDALLAIIASIPEAKEAGLAHLCEFIEDCEFTFLSTRILHLLGQQGPRTSAPTKYIRYIYNRLSLENAHVRASAVSALAHFAVALDHMRPQIAVLLRRCLSDADDEVRDRAVFYLGLIEARDSTLAVHTLAAADEVATALPNLDAALADYLANPDLHHLPFDVRAAAAASTLADSAQPSANAAAADKRRQTTAAATSSAGSSRGAEAEAAGSSVARADPYTELLAQVPQFAALGARFRSSAPVELTESETEYVVNCVKHVFAQHIVFQFNCTNTLADQQLQRVHVKMAAPDGFKVESHVPCPELPAGAPGITYVCVRRLTPYAIGTFTSTVLKFTVKEVDSSGSVEEGAGYDDEYQLEDVDVAIGDYVQRVHSNNFQEEWEQLGDGCEAVETYNLSSLKNLQDAVKDITGYLGMQPCDRTETVPPKRNKHILYLAGTFVGGVPVLARARMMADPSGQGVNMELTVRSADAEISAALASAT